MMVGYVVGYILYGVGWNGGMVRDMEIELAVRQQMDGYVLLEVGQDQYRLT